MNRTTRVLRHALAMVLVLAATSCEPRAGDPDATAGVQDTIPASAPDDTPAVARDLTFAERAPDSLLVRRGACPFECCVYGDWALEVAAPVRASPDTQAAVTFTVAPNQRFHADSGFVRVTERSYVAVHDTVDQRPYSERFLPGDTLLVLDYVGEGHFNVWTGSKVVDVEGFWGAEQPGKPVAELLGSYAREWWAHITLDAKQGWLLIEPNRRVIGADACGGPPPWHTGR